MWKNWSGSISNPNATVLTPASRLELANVLRSAEQAGTQVRAVGAGHSFSSLVDTDDTIVSLDHVQGIIDVNDARRVVRVHAGTRIFALNAALEKRGYAMSNLGDINVQSIAGATSTGTHGTGITLGNIATQIESLKIMRADGREITASKEENPDLFEGGRIGLGALGILTEIGLNVVPSFRLKAQRGKMGFDECLAQTDTLIRRHRSFELYWLPHTDAMLTKSWDLTDEAATHNGMKRYFTESVLENLAFGLLCDLGKYVPSMCPSISRFCASLIGPGQHVDTSHLMLSSPRRVRFNEMEWSVPAEHGAEALREIRALISQKAFPLMFPLEYRWVRGDDIWLSPNYGRDSVHISAHQYRAMPYKQYFDGVQAICLNYGGRPHWGKMHTLKGRDLAKLYPRWDDFLALRARMDPHGRFLSPYLGALFGLDCVSSPATPKLKESCA